MAQSRQKTQIAPQFWKTSDEETNSALTPSWPSLRFNDLHGLLAEYLIRPFVDEAIPD